MKFYTIQAIVAQGLESHGKTVDLPKNSF